ncbi:hypothetical protein OQA88_8925 [Cercophora sp. LCS_1]
MDGLHHHFGARRVWDKYDVDKSPTFKVTEIWVHDESSSSTVDTRSVVSLGLDNWLDEPPHKYISGGPHTRAVRIAWVGLDADTSRHLPSTRDLDRLLQSWSLKPAYSYAMSCFAGVTALPPVDGIHTYTTAYHPKLAVAWSHSVVSSTPSTNIVIFAEGEERAELLRALKTPWSPSAITNPMFPALLSSLILSQDLDTTLSAIKTVVRNVEARTGHHRFTTRRQTRPAAGELGFLSAEMSGCSAKLANGTRKLKVIEAINTFIGEYSTPFPITAPKHEDMFVPSPQHQKQQTDSLAGHVPLLKSRAEMQSIDLTYVHSRVQVQIAALFHLIAQQDNAIAFETASATRSIAKDSLQDSSAMKMLALVAMFFLPGSFVAALFSTPLFEWGSGSDDGNMGVFGVQTKKGFGLFWAVAVPLTAFVFGVYAVYVGLVVRRGKRRFGGLEKGLA